MTFLRQPWFWHPLPDWGILSSLPGIAQAMQTRPEVKSFYAPLDMPGIGDLL